MKYSLILFSLLLVCTQNCKVDPLHKICEPNESRPCTCQGGIPSSQYCSADRLSWKLCDCPGTDEDITPNETLVNSDTYDTEITEQYSGQVMYWMASDLREDVCECDETDCLPNLRLFRSTFGEESKASEITNQLACLGADMDYPLALRDLSPDGQWILTATDHNYEECAHNYRGGCLAIAGANSFNELEIIRYSGEFVHPHSAGAGAIAVLDRTVVVVYTNETGETNETDELDLLLIQKKDNQWSQPLNLTGELAECSNAIFPDLSPEGDLLFICSNNIYGYGNSQIYQINDISGERSIKSIAVDSCNTIRSATFDDEGFIIYECYDEGREGIFRLKDDGSERIWNEDFSPCNVPGVGLFAISGQDFSADGELNPERISVPNMEEWTISNTILYCSQLGV